MDWYILDENDKPILADILTASEFLQSGKRVVDFTQVNSTCYLSTVFLCLDHNHRGRGGPVLYESLWFGGIHDNEMRRYFTKEEALLGHKQMLEEFKKENLEDLEFGDWDIVKL